MMDEEAMKTRTKRFALRVRNLVDSLPKTDKASAGQPAAALWNLGGSELSSCVSGENDC